MTTLGNWISAGTQTPFYTRKEILIEQFHCLLDFPALPDTSARIVRRAEDCRVDMVFCDFLLHIGKIHPPDSVSILFQRTVNRMIAAAVQNAGKTYIGGMEQKTKNEKL